MLLYNNNANSHWHSFENDFHVNRQHDSLLD